MAAGPIRNEEMVATAYSEADEGPGGRPPSGPAWRYGDGELHQEG